MMQDLDRSLDMNLITDSKMLSCESGLLLSNARAMLRTTKGIYERVVKGIMAEREESKFILFVKCSNFNRSVYSIIPNNNF